MATRTRARKKQLKRLTRDAQDLWRDQQAVLARANSVLGDARTQAGHLSREEWGPGLKTAYADRVAPSVDKLGPTGKKVGAAGKVVGSTARDAVTGTVVPAITSIGVAALTIAGNAKDELAKRGVSFPGAVEDAAKRGKKARKSLAATTADQQKRGKKAARRTAAAVKGGRAAAKVASSKAGRTVAKAAVAKRVSNTLPKQKSGIGAGGVVGIALGVLALAGIGYAVWQTLRADDDLWVADDEPEVPPAPESTPSV